MLDNHFIAVSERLYTEDDGDAVDVWRHASLYLMRKIEGSDRPEILQRLCFNNQNGGLLTPNLRKGEPSDDTLKNHDFAACSNGDTLSVFRDWNRMLQASKIIRAEGFRFGADYRHSPTALNCRTGVMATVKAAGLPFDESLVRSRAGLRVEDIPVEAIRRKIINPPSSLEDIRVACCELQGDLSPPQGVTLDV